MTEENKDLGLFMDWFSLQSKAVQKNATIVSADELGQNYMLHIDKNTPKVFIPMMPKSAAGSENATVARITVAPHIQGCITGYARVENDFLDSGIKKVSKDPFRGGYDICILEFEHCLKPNANLVYDAKRSQEHWLVSYRPDLIQYKPKKIGKFFVKELTFKRESSEKIAESYLQGYLEHNYAPGIYYTPTTLINAGYHRLSWKIEDPHINNRLENFSNFSVVQCTKEEYEREKSLTAALLSYGQSSITPKWTEF
jgi:hypothetical protein